MFRNLNGVFVENDVLERVEWIVTEELAKISKGRYSIQISGNPTVFKTCKAQKSYKCLDLTKTIKLKDVEDLLAERLQGAKVYFYAGQCNLDNVLYCQITNRSLLVPIATEHGKKVI